MGSSPPGFDAKNRSNSVKNTPLSSSLSPLKSGASISLPTVKVCARGSLLRVIVLVADVVIVVVTVVTLCNSRNLPLAV